MTDDAEHLLHGTANSPISKTTTAIHCQCRCPNVNESEIKASWCQKTSSEQHGNIICCHCCRHCCCCCVNAKRRVTPDTKAADLLNKSSSQENMSMEQQEDMEKDTEDAGWATAAFDVEAKVVEYRQKFDNKKHEVSNYIPMPAISDELDATLRYSFKGIPPETYSAKKEFIYTRPLVEKQVNRI